MPRDDYCGQGITRDDYGLQRINGMTSDEKG